MVTALDDDMVPDGVPPLTLVALTICPFGLGSTDIGSPFGKEFGTGLLPLLVRCVSYCIITCCCTQLSTAAAKPSNVNFGCAGSGTTSGGAKMD